MPLCLDINRPSHWHAGFCAGLSTPKLIIIYMSMIGSVSLHVQPWLALDMKPFFGWLYVSHLGMEATTVTCYITINFRIVTLQILQSKAKYKMFVNHRLLKSIYRVLYFPIISPLY